MPTPHAAFRDDTPVFHHQPGIGRMVLRRFDPRRDSWERLTMLLHRAFASLAAGGLHCESADQPASVTRQRALAGDCFVALCNGRVIGTMTLEARDPQSPCEHYRLRGVATLHQFGVEPSWQSRGIGAAMLAFAARWAATHGYAQLALDTPFPAAHLLAFYRAQGFALVDVVQFAGRGYDSAVFSKPTGVELRSVG
ncbi:Acetyltransferase (GNAT) family protein [Paraburkholderia caballeronis]|uniref:Acetyltransferase (GNAT) family protein n=2 Tax=Paraburkholderia caballeronis TaxID=416943 RepID=A0A1H7W0C5_9BURK|nr:acetyltransferase (GNAT) family protein [Paraburkholderia caballeronis]PXW96872.1 acetyltransferase (GNAT) family protein [Paraburkholderia caballeronis]RAJ93499.1 acetyltransferase (GNAT) family protein [Paraburkholderia caballeronis]SEC75147.1 Acetyltransferase (GNAT) family protein [Paraburkholderia caballeronis]SEM14933.1 Acetyltransferase (GNAT) family protein [Paraburkholderia caballeronis]